MMLVASNLYMALEHLRHENEDRILWIDAICINQDDNQEKTHQVRQMGRIYKDAEKVVIWLGESTEETDHVMDAMKQWHDYNVTAQGDWRQLAELWMHPQLSRKHELGEETTDLKARWCEGMEKMLKRPWFYRIWILQEIANAQVAIVLCGRKSVSTRIFSQVPALIELKVNARCQAVLDIMPGLSRRESWWNRKRSLHTLLMKFGASYATDERDIIYALLGISTDAYNGDVLFPDYSKSLSEVIRDTTSFLVFQRGHDDTPKSSPEWNLQGFLKNLDSIGDKNVELFNELLAESDTEKFTLLIASDAVEIDRPNYKGRTPLHLKARTRHEAIVRLLIEKGAKVNCVDNYGKTALHQASAYGREANVKLLVQKGAKLELEDGLGRTPLHTAAIYGHEAIVRFLIENGARPKSKKRREKLSVDEAIQEELKFWRNTRP